MNKFASQALAMATMLCILAITPNTLHAQLVTEVDILLKVYNGSTWNSATDGNVVAVLPRGTATTSAKAGFKQYYNGYPHEFAGTYTFRNGSAKLYGCKYTTSEWEHCGGLTGFTDYTFAVGVYTFRAQMKMAGANGSTYIVDDEQYSIIVKTNVGAPANFRITNSGTDGAYPNLAWSAETGATKYRVYRCLADATLGQYCNSDSVVAQRELEFSVL